MKYMRAAFRFALFVITTFGLYAIWWIGSIFIPNKLYWRQLIFGFWTGSFVRLSGYDDRGNWIPAETAVFPCFQSFELYGYRGAAFRCDRPFLLQRLK